MEKENNYPVKLYDIENNFVYTVFLSKEEAQRCKTDIEFAQEVLKDAAAGPVRDMNNMMEEIQNKEHEEILKNKQTESEDEKSTWAYNETICLINAYESHQENFKIAKKKKFVWKDISNVLSSNGFEKSAEKCDSKWKNLLRTYKNVKDLRNKTGRGTIKFQFFDKLDDLLGEKPVMDCAHTFSSTEGSTNTNASTHIEESVTGDNSVTEESAFSTNIEVSTENNNISKKKKVEGVLKKKTEELLNIKINYFKNKQKEQESRELRREKKIELREKMVELEERKLKLLEQVPQ